jgi:preprotein translocase subunit SecF/SecD/SecF fusion protein
VLITASVFLLATRGLNFGVDFAGGTLMELQASETVREDSVRAAVPIPAEVNAAIGTDARQIIVVKFGDAPASLLGENFQALEPDEQSERAAQFTNELIVRTLNEAFPGIEILRNDTVGPKVSAELFRDGVTALIVALILMLMYIWYRFEWQFSVGAVSALAHDVIITLGVFAFLQLEFNLTTIAALLTIIGYSMNDTVVVFDRVREEKRKYKKMADRLVINLALNATLSRTVLTSGTTLLALMAIFLLGGPVLRGMSFALIWGIIIGTYSSIFIASSIVLSLGMNLGKRSDDAEAGKAATEGAAT